MASEVPVHKVVSLIIPRRDDRVWFWEKTDIPDGVPRRLPVGGAVERGETPDGHGGVIPADGSMLEAATREANEEGGITVLAGTAQLLAIMQYVHRDNPRRNRRAYWWCADFVGEPRAIEQHMIDPQSYPVDALPREMFEADRGWLPQALKRVVQSGFEPIRLSFIYSQGLYEGPASFDEDEAGEETIPIFRY